jgi:hypothetical protein
MKHNVLIRNVIGNIRMMSIELAYNAPGISGRLLLSVLMPLLDCELIMKPKKIYKYWKYGEVFENDKLWNVRKFLKRHLLKRTCRFRKHKLKQFDE